MPGTSTPPSDWSRPGSRGGAAGNWRSPVVGLLLWLACAAGADAARFVDVRVTDAAPLADGTALTLDLATPSTPGPHPVLVAVDGRGAAMARPDAAAVRRSGWLQATVKPRAGMVAADLAATLGFVHRQIGAWGGDSDRIVMMIDADLHADLVDALAVGGEAPAGVVVRVDGDDAGAADAGPVPGVRAPLLVLFDAAQDGARRDALRIAANWRRAGARADVLPLPASAQVDVVGDGLDRWAAAFALPRVARWESLVTLSESAAMPKTDGRMVGLVSHAGRLHAMLQGSRIESWEAIAGGAWRRNHVWGPAEAFAWFGQAVLEVDTLFAVLVDGGRPQLWMREATGAWVAVADADVDWVGPAESRVVAQPRRAAAAWLVDDGRGATIVFEVASTGGAPVRVQSMPGLAGRLVDASVFDDALVAATRVDDGVTLWRYDAEHRAWQVRARLDADTRTLGSVDGGTRLLAYGKSRIERLDATAVAPTVELELAEAFATLLDVPAAAAVRAVAPQAVPLVHPETGEAALLIGIDVADPDTRAPPARYLVRDASGRYAIGEAWDAKRGQGGWPQTLVMDPGAVGVVHALPAGGDAPWSAGLAVSGPRRGLWAATDGEGWLAIERAGARWSATLMLPAAAGGLDVRLATGAANPSFAADAPGALDFAGKRDAEPLVVAFDADARAACAAEGHVDAGARASLGPGDNARHHCFRRPGGSALPTGLNGAWGGGEGRERWLAFVDASRQRDDVVAELVLVVRDRDGGARLVRGTGAGAAGELDLPLYDGCAGCGSRPIGNFRLVVDGACGADVAAAGFVLLLPDGAGFRQRAHGAIERMAGPACY